MSAGANIDQSISRGLIFAIVVTSVTLVAEVIGGLWTNSLALLSDAAHVFMDLFALLLSLLAIRLAGLAATDRRTYGWHRAEIFASLINGVTLIAMAGGILWAAWDRIFDPQEIRAREMFIIATVGLIMNLVAASRLHRHAQDDLNVRSAFLHVLGDAIASVGVIAGGVIMHYTGWYVLDALISVAIALLIGWGSLRIIREAAHILLEGVPRHVSIEAVVRKIRAVPGVSDIHHLHVWSICSHISALSAHVDVLPEFRLRQGEIVGAIEQLLEHDFHITHSTLQVECSSCLSGDIIQQLRHQPRHSSLCSHGHGPGPSHDRH